MDEVRRRRVAEFIFVSDPSGIATELYCGPSVQSDISFRSPRDIAGFEASHLGLGHIVLAVDDCDASMRFYRDGLGLKVSDFIDLDTDCPDPTRVAFLRCGPRHHSLAIARLAAPKRLHRSGCTTSCFRCASCATWAARSTSAATRRCPSR